MGIYKDHMGIHMGIVWRNMRHGDSDEDCGGDNHIGGRRDGTEGEWGYMRFLFSPQAVLSMEVRGRGDRGGGNQGSGGGLPYLRYLWAELTGLRRALGAY